MSRPNYGQPAVNSDEKDCLEWELSAVIFNQFPRQKSSISFLSLLERSRKQIQLPFFSVNVINSLCHNILFFFHYKLCSN